MPTNDASIRKMSKKEILEHITDRRTRRNVNYCAMWNSMKALDGVIWLIENK